MNEIEVKVLDINKSDLINKLKSINATLVKREFQNNYMFDYPDNRFFSKGGYVRIRKSFSLLDKKEKVVLTFKELVSRDKFKVSKEIEFKADDFQSARDFLEALGLKVFRIDEKFRESYKLEEGLIEIDTWAGVPTYFEAEAESEEKVEILLNKLGYQLSQSTSMTLAEIMKHYNIEDSNRLFSEEEKKQLLGY